MKILLGNPNTSQSVTDTIAAAARAVASSGTEIKAVTGKFGARVIGTRAEMAIGEHASLDMMAREAEGCDAVIIGASLDSALRAAREMLTVPVLGITESALHTACLLGGRFGLVVMASRSAVVTREMVEGYGLTSRLAGLRWIDTSPLFLQGDPEAAATAIAVAANALVAEDLAETVVLIGAVMAGMPARVQDRVPVPVIEGVACAVVLGEALVRLRLPKATAGSYARLPKRELVGVSDAIAARFTG